MTQQKEALARVVDNCQPETLITCGQLATELGETWCRHHESATLTEIPSRSPATSIILDQPKDLALISHVLESLDRQEGELLLGQLRNFGTRKIAVLVRDNCDWSMTDFIGLGFSRQDRPDNPEPATLYTYNIDTYNHKRAWNNPDYWANPEMWGKAWW